MAYRSEEGYLIRWSSLGEGDRWLTFFTRSSGLRKVVVSRRKLEQMPVLANPVMLDRGALTLLSRPGPHRGERLVEYSLLARHLWLARDLELLGIAALILEAVERLSAEDDPQPAVFSLLEGFLAEIREGTAPVITGLHSLQRLFALLGYEPAFDRCRVCQGPPGRGNRFLAAKGGFVHERCSRGESAALPVSPGTLLFLSRLASRSPAEARRLKGDRRVMRESSDVLGAYLNFLCQRRLNSQVFLGKVARRGPRPPAGERREGRA